MARVQTDPSSISLSVHAPCHSGNDSEAQKAAFAKAQAKLKANREARKQDKEMNKKPRGRPKKEKKETPVDGHPRNICASLKDFVCTVKIGKKLRM